MVAATDQPAPENHGKTNHSTGPRTPEGKARSSMNALKHGLAAKTPLIPGEDAEEFLQFVWDIVEDLEPEGPVQAELAQRAAVLMWRRRRAVEAERQAIKELAENYVRDDGDGEEEANANGQKQEVPVDPEDPLRLVRFIIADEFASPKPKQPLMLDRLARYDQRLSQEIDSTIRLLLKLQNRKQWRRQQEQRPERDQDAVLARPAPPPAQQNGAPISPPHAPAQNELLPKPPTAPEDGPAGAWRGPPGSN